MGIRHERKMIEKKRNYNKVTKTKKKNSEMRQVRSTENIADEKKYLE